MEDRLKRRLVGATVLVSLAVIFLPMLVEEPQVPEQTLETTNIPPKPKDLEEDFQSSVVPLPDDEPLIPPLESVTANEHDAVEPPSDDPVSASGEAIDSGAEGPAVSPPADQSRSPEIRTGISAWVVQVASLSNDENARRLTEELREQGYSTFLEQVSIDGKDLFRVRVGPEIDRKRAERMAVEIDAAFNVKSRILRYP